MERSALLEADSPDGRVLRAKATAVCELREAVARDDWAAVAQAVVRAGDFDVARPEVGRGRMPSRCACVAFPLQALASARWP